MTERMNMHRMQVPERRSNLVRDFEAERDVIAEDWSNIDRYLLGARQSGAWQDFVETAANVKLVDPKRAPTITQDGWRDIISYQKTELTSFISTNSEEALRYLMAMKTLRPEFTPSNAERRRILEWRKNCFSNAMREGDGSPAWNLLAMIFACMKLIMPRHESSLSPEEWGAMSHRARTVLSQRETLRDGYDMAAHMRIIDPSDEMSLPSASRWASFKQILLKDRQRSDWKTFCKDAAHMKILASDKVHVTDAGLELNTQLQGEEKTRPMPESPQV